MPGSRRSWSGRQCCGRVLMRSWPTSKAVPGEPHRRPHPRPLLRRRGVQNNRQSRAVERRWHTFKEPPRVLGKRNDSMGFPEGYGVLRTRIDSRQDYTAGNSRIFSQPCTWPIISSCLSIQHPAAHFTCLYCPLRGVIQSGHKNTHTPQKRQPSLRSPRLAGTCQLDTSNHNQTRRISQLLNFTKVP